MKLKVFDIKRGDRLDEMREFLAGPITVKFMSAVGVAFQPATMYFGLDKPEQHLITILYEEN